MLLQKITQHHYDGRGKHLAQYGIDVKVLHEKTEDKIIERKAGDV